ncbi:MAG TPA: SDR family oxidoreductase [Gemmatimonadaceae bacterium]|nr:SDR family oxidoreductase [Gemmatimonadaceae bacterium]
MILVVGATGLLGSEICRRLRGRGRPVRGLVRPGSSRGAALRDLGVEIVEGDLRARESLDVACEGVAAVVSTATAMGSKDRTLSLRSVDYEGQLRLVDVARAHAVPTFVYMSVSPNLRPTAPLVRYKRAVERVLRGSGMRWTALQPSVFMDVWLGSQLGWDHIVGRATVFGSGAAPLSWIAASDVAEHAVRAIDDERLVNIEVPLGGPERLSPNDVVRIFEEVSGRPYRVWRLPRPMLAFLAPFASLIDEGIGSGMGMGAQTAKGDPIDSPLQRELALPLTTVRQYAERVLRRGA